MGPGFGRGEVLHIAVAGVVGVVEAEVIAVVVLQVVGLVEPVHYVAFVGSVVID